MKNYTIAVGDLHGRFDIFEKAIQKINEYQKEDNLTVVFLGDYVDRGPQARQILEALIKGPQVKNQSWIILKGNHEQMMSEGLKGGPVNNAAMWNCWLGNGGDTTIASYKNSNGMQLAIPVEHIKFIDSMRLFYEDDKRMYVHAWVGHDIEAKNLSEDFLLWKRYSNGDNWTYKGKHICHGHTPDPNGPVFKLNRTNLDTAATWSGRLVLGVFDDAIAGGPIETIEVKCKGE